MFLYIIGGVTYAEARITKELRAKYPDTQFYIGGTHLLHAVKYCRPNSVSARMY